jgi:APA family basic amino acid/polyamine antiporter
VTAYEKTQTSPRAIGTLAAFTVVAGSMLGVGIFLSPPIVANNVDSAAALILVWVLGGIIALSGAVACAELGAMLPRSGGDYVFQYEAFGASVAFASGWVVFIGIFCGSVATLSVALCTYQLPTLLGYDPSAIAFVLPGIGSVSTVQALALVFVASITVINSLGTHLSVRAQTILTLIPISIFSALALYAITTTSNGPTAAGGGTDVVPETSLQGFVVAYMAVYFAYAGWINIIYVAGEVKRPERNVPRALIGGTVVVMMVYLLLCTAFIRVLGMEGLRTAGEAGSATAAVVGGDGGRILVAILIAIAVTACLNATVLGGVRVAYAMAQRGALWSRLGMIGERHKVPHLALRLQALIASVLVVTGHFEQLYLMVSLAMVVTGSLTVASLFVLRRTRPGADRPFRATAYPFFSALYLVSSALVIVVMTLRALSGEPGAWYPLLGVGILVVMYGLHRSVPVWKD